MRLLPVVLALMALVPAPALGQSSLPPAQAGPATTPAVPEPGPSVSVPLPPLPKEAEVDRGEGTFHPLDLTALPDAPPAPNPARSEPSTGGADVIVEPAGGDPFFLGFWGGNRYPAAGESLDPLLAEALARLGADGRPQPEVFGFVMFSKRMTEERLATLAALGCRVLGTHPHYSLKVALPLATVAQVASQDFVRWVGVAEPWQKSHPITTARFGMAQEGESLDLWISVFDTDLNPASTFERVGSVAQHDPGREPIVLGAEASPALVWQSRGWQQEALEALGAQVVEYVDAVRAFRVSLPAVRLPELLSRDFVLAVDSVLPATLGHEESMPMISADYSRQFYDGGTNSVAIAGIVDSGMRIAHEALTSHYSYGYDLTDNGAGHFADACGHGSHVIGTILGDPPAANARFRGVAPKLGFAQNARFRSAKIFDPEPGDDCAWNSSSSLSAILGTMRGVQLDSGNNASPRPHVINHSWGSGPTSGGFFGSETDPRTIDAEIWNEDQLHVFIGHNYGPNASTVSVHGSAKNTLTVGSVTDFGGAVHGDPGGVANSSARGPTADGRWKPNVTAPGTSILSVNSGGLNTYSSKSGTSMACPHVVGMASQLVDHWSFVRYAPHRLSSLMMGTATTKDNQALTSPSTSAAHLNAYGAGRVNGYRAHFPDGEALLLNWGFSQGFSGFQSGDFTVSPGATRLVVVMHYTEPASSAGASQAVNADFDLYLDREPFTAGGNTGEYTAQQSNVDNTEIRYVDNPPVGEWRWKVYPQNVSILEVANVSVTVSVLYGDTTPDGTLNVTPNKAYAQPGEEVTFTATVTNPENVASAIYLDTTSHTGASLQNTTTTLKDGVVTNLTTTNNGIDSEKGFDVTLGDVIHGQSRFAKWTVTYGTSGTKSWTVNARSDNWPDETDTAQVVIDGTAPGVATALGSSTHQINVWSNDPNIVHTWTAATDALSGIDGYGIFLTSAASEPGNTKDIGAVTSYADAVASTTSSRWFNIKAVDKAGNWSGSFASRGPYKIDLTPPSAPTNLVSTSHQVNVWSNDPTIDFQWTPATDAHSGLGGYAHSTWSTLPLPPGSTPSLPAAATTHTSTISNGSNVHFSLRAVDAAGNPGTSWGQVGPFKIDTTAPSSISPLTSSTHVVNAWSTSTSLQVSWAAATDSGSGVAGYAVAVDQSPITFPSGPFLLVNTSTTTNLSSSPSGWYVHVRAKDVAGNFGPTSHLGPFLVDNGAPVLGTVAIDAGSPYAAGTAVTLSLSASNAASGLKDMRFKNDGGTFSPYEPFAATKAWNLTAFSGSTALGTRTVTVEIRDVANNVTTASDSIYLYEPVTYFGTACAGQAGVPSFTITGIPGFGQPVTFQVTNTAAATGALVLGVSNTQYGAAPLPLSMGPSGCFLNVSFDVVLFTGPVIPLPAVIPSEPLIVGLPLYFQWFLADPAGYTVTTQGARMRIAGA